MLISTLEGHRGTVPSAAFDDSGERVVTGGGDGFIGVWDALSGRSLAMIPRHTDAVNDVQFFEGDDLRILSASDDWTVRIAGCPACQSLEELRGRAAELVAADGRVHLTPPRVGECFAFLVDYREPVDCGEPHYAEVFAVLTPEAAEDAPRPSGVEDWAQGQCEGCAYREYRGVDSDDDAEYDALAFGPQTSAEWDLGQRRFSCVLIPAFGPTMEGSARRPG